MGIVVDMNGLLLQLESMNDNLKTYEVKADNVAKAIDKLKNIEKQLDSAGYDAIKSYFDVPYKGAIKQIKYACLVLRQNNKLFTTYIGETGLGHGIISEDDINDAIRDCEAKIVKYETFSSNCEKGDAKSDYHKSGKSAKYRRYQSLIISNQAMIDELNEDLKTLKNLEKKSHLLFVGQEEMYSKIQSNINKITPVPNISEDAFKTANSKKPSFDSIINDYIEVRDNLRELVETAGDPVNMSTGNYIYERSFLKADGRINMELKFTYNSLAEDKNCLGNPGWSHQFDIRLTTAKNKMTLFLEGGREENYTLKDHKFVSDYGFVNRSLKKSVDQNFYEYLDEDKNKYTFNYDGQCLRKENVNSEGISFEYSDGKLSKVCCDSGIEYEFSYEKINIVEEKALVLSSVSDNGERKIELVYENGNLSKIINETGKSYNYIYDENNKLEQVINPRGVKTVVNKYDGLNRVVSQRFPDGGEMKYAYLDTENKIIFTDQSKSKTEYIHDEKQRTVEIVYPDGNEKNNFNNQNQKVSSIDKNGNKTRYEYNKEGLQSAIINPIGDKLKTEYTNSGKVKSITINGNSYIKAIYNTNGSLVKTIDANNSERKFSYTEKGQIKEVCLPDGSNMRIEYDRRGNISKVTDIYGNETRYEYDSLNRATKSFDGKGNKTQYEYDKKNNLIKIINSLGQISEYEYNEVDMVTKIKDFDGHTILREYNSLNKISKEIDKNGNITEFGYDKSWRLYKTISPGGCITKHLYDKLGRENTLLKMDKIVEKYEYDANGNRIKVIDAEGNITRYTYDALNRVISVAVPNGAETKYDYDVFGNITKETDPNGNETLREYNNAGELIKETDPKGNITDLEYSPLGKITKKTVNGENTTEYVYYPGGNLKKAIEPYGTYLEYEYDENNNIISKTNQNGYIVNYEYDILNRLIKTIEPDNRINEFKYDNSGNIIETIDANGNKTQYKYSPNSELISVEDPLGNTTEYDYDKDGNLIAIIQVDPDLANVVRTIKYERNPLGDITKTIDQLGHMEEYKYNLNRQIITKIDKDGNQTNFAYDSAGNVSSIQYADGHEVKYRYNALKMLIQIEDWLGSTEIRRDQFGRELEIIDHRDKKISYEWNNYDYKTAIHYPDNKVAKYDINNLGTLNQVSFEGKHIQYNYDKNGYLQTKNFENGTQIEYDYTPTGFISNMTLSKDNKVIDNFSYKYDKLDNKIEAIKQRVATPEDSGVFQYGYDPLGRLTHIIKDNIEINNYSYDPFGNRTKMNKNNSETTYKYNALNQLITKEANGGQTDYVYDKRGNLTKIQENGQIINEYFFDSRNRLRHAANLNGEKAKYDYNGLGFRTSRTKTTEYNSIQQINYVLDQSKVYNNLLEIESNYDNMPTRAIAWDIDPVLINESDNTYSYFNDEMGSPMRLLNSTGDIAETKAYDAFGLEITSETAPEIQPLGFSGYIEDDVSGTQFAQAREYDYINGRFTGQDKIKGQIDMPMTINNYTYCYNNPNKYVDKDGNLAPLVIIGIVAVGAVSATAGGVASYYQQKKQGKEIDWFKVGVDAAVSGVVGAGAAFIVAVGGTSVLAAAAAAFGLGGLGGLAAYITKTTYDHSWSNKSIQQHLYDALESMLSFGVSNISNTSDGMKSMLASIMGLGAQIGLTSLKDYDGLSII